MVTLTKIYTRGGDTGETSLGDGSRISKDDLRVEAFGAVDEANSAIGIARLHTAGTPIDIDLAAIQNELFDIGGDLCVPIGQDEADGDGGAQARLRVEDGQIVRLETRIDALNENLSDLTSFVLPGGTPAAAYLHFARTLVRRAERLVVSLAARDAVNPAVVRYLNRLSDYLFVAARAANDPAMSDGAGDVLWVPGQTRAS